MVDGYVERLGNLTPHKAEQWRQQGLINKLFVYLGPDNEAAQANRRDWAIFRSIYKGPMWSWWVNGADQQQDANDIKWVDQKYGPTGHLLDIEKVLQHKKLTPLINDVALLGKPIIASLAGSAASYTNYDFRTLDQHKAVIEWQNYMDSGEGPPPDIGVKELFKSSFVIAGWEYRCSWGYTYGWGKVTGAHSFDSYRVPPPDASFKSRPREWGVWVDDDRTLTYKGKKSGQLLGRVPYSRIRSALDVTRGAAAKHTAAEWTAIAASARVPNAKKRPTSVYLLEVCPEPVLRAISTGAA